MQKHCRGRCQDTEKFAVQPNVWGMQDRTDRKIGGLTLSCPIFFQIQWNRLPVLFAHFSLSCCAPMFLPRGHGIILCADLICSSWTLLQSCVCVDFPSNISFLVESDVVFCFFFPFISTPPNEANCSVAFFFLRFDFLLTQTGKEILRRCDRFLRTWQAIATTGKAKIHVLGGMGLGAPILEALCRSTLMAGTCHAVGR